MTEIATPVPTPRSLTAKRKKVYISGPMTGHEDYNFPAFAEAAKWLRDNDYAAISPAESLGGDTSKTWEFYMRIAIGRLLQADMVACLPNWENSRGAKLEVCIAQALGIPVVEFGDLEKSVGIWLEPRISGRVTQHGPED